jgi:hypothetical protein
MGQKWILNQARNTEIVPFRDSNRRNLGHDAARNHAFYGLSQTDAAQGRGNATLNTRHNDRLNKSAIMKSSS